jgi:hypothetical protein
MARNQGTACKISVNLVTQNTRRMVPKRTCESWETKLVNCEIPSQAIRPIAKFFTKRSGPRHHLQYMAPSVPYFFVPVDKASIIADCLENQLTADDLYDCDRR